MPAYFLDYLVFGSTTAIIPLCNIKRLAVLTFCHTQEIWG